MNTEMVRQLVKVCSWCVRSGVTAEIEKQRVAQAAGALITHGMCPGCQKAFRAEREARYCAGSAA